MARGLGETTITLSVLDRLIDEEPGNSQEIALSRKQSIRALRISVRRDLEWILNTRRINDLPEEEFKEIPRSVYAYGLPCLSSLSMGGASDRGLLMRQIATTIGFFEPRLAQVNVSLVESADSAKFEVRLRIEALLRMDPSPEPVSFDSVIELKSGTCRLSGGDDA